MAYMSSRFLTTSLRFFLARKCFTSKVFFRRFHLEGFESIEIVSIHFFLKAFLIDSFTSVSKESVSEMWAPDRPLKDHILK